MLLEGLERPQRPSELDARRIAVAGRRIGFSRPPERHRFAALVAGGFTHFERACNSRTRGGQIAAVERNLSEHQLKLALQFLVADGASESETLLEVLARLVILGQIHADFAEMAYTDRFLQTRAELTEQCEGFLLVGARALGVALVEPDPRKVAKGSGDLIRGSEATE